MGINNPVIGGGDNGEADWLKPVVADFATRDGGVASFSDGDYGVIVEAPVTTLNVNSLYYAVQPLIAAGAGGRIATGRFRRHSPVTLATSTGMLLRDSVGGRSRAYSLMTDVVTGFNRNQFTDDDTWNSVAEMAGGFLDMNFWLQIEDNLTDHIVRVSSNGINWQQIYQEARANWMTPTHVGFFINPNGNGATSVNLRGHLLPFECLSWEQSALA